MRHHPFIALTFAVLVFPAPLVSVQDGAVRITYLYDNTTTSAALKADWGFACLVEGRGRTILFDTGTRPGILRDNIAALKVDVARVQALVLSHPHGDHTLGVGALPVLPGLPVYAGVHFRLPPAADTELVRIGARRIAVPPDAPVEIFPGFMVTNEMPSTAAYEEALVIDTADGAVVIVGCAHPGIVAILERAAEMTRRPIHMVIGGFHLLRTPNDDVRRIIAKFKSLRVAWVAPSHCTGDEAIRLLREAYGDHFIAGGVGTQIEVPRTRSVSK